jgi:hypothetical protein
VSRGFFILASTFSYDLVAAIAVWFFSPGTRTRHDDRPLPMACRTIAKSTGALLKLGLKVAKRNLREVDFNHIGILSNG